MRWSKKATEFSVKVNYVDDGTGHRIRVPEPILEKLGYPTYIKFTKKSNEIIVTGHSRKTKRRLRQ